MTRTAEVIIAQIGGNCPVQAEGTVDGQPFYFRARGSRWSMEIGGAPTFGTAAWEHSEHYGEWPAAGWMTEDEARRFIAEAAELWRLAQPPEESGAPGGGDGVPVHSSLPPDEPPPNPLPEPPERVS